MSFTQSWILPRRSESKRDHHLHEQQPGYLPSLWVQLDQNIYKKDSRARLMGGGRGRRNADPSVPTPSTDGFVFDSVEIETGAKLTKAEYIVCDTRMQIRLAKPLAGRGGQLRSISLSL